MKEVSRLLLCFVLVFMQSASTNRAQDQGDVLNRDSDERVTTVDERQQTVAILLAAAETARSIGDSVKAARYLNRAGRLQLVLAHADEALQNYQQALSTVAEQDAPTKIASLNGIGAVYTYKSGLRAPAMIAFVKDILIYVTVIAAVLVIPVELGGYGPVFEAATKVFDARGGPGGLLLKPSQMLPFASLALGSALALFMYPHSVTGILSSSSARTIRWNAILLPAYTLLLGLIALLGYMAIANNVKVESPNDAVPALFLKIFPEWFVGFAFAAIAIGALVPSAIMSIGAAKLFTRNIWKPFFRPQISPGEETTVAKVTSLVVKLGALIFIIFLPAQYAIDFQLLGGIWILQTFPAVVLGLYRVPVRGGPLFIGWLAGMLSGTWFFVATGLKPVVPIAGLGTVYIAIVALVLNLVISLAGSLVPARQR